MKGGILADVYTTDLYFANGDPSDKQRLRPHLFTIELDFVEIATRKSSTAIFRRMIWLEDAHTYGFFYPQTFSCRETRHQEAPLGTLSLRTRGHIRNQSM